MLSLVVLQLGSSVANREVEVAGMIMIEPNSLLALDFFL